MVGSLGVGRGADRGPWQSSGRDEGWGCLRARGWQERREKQMDLIDGYMQRVNQHILTGLCMCVCVYLIIFLFKVSI